LLKNFIFSPFIFEVERIFNCFIAKIFQKSVTAQKVCGKVFLSPPAAGKAAHLLSRYKNRNFSISGS